MKIIAYIVCFVMFVIINTSCSSTFYYATVNCNPQTNGMDQLENGDFKTENDSLWVAYCFNGASAPVQITVFNKSAKAMYVDWQKSNIMLRDRTYDYMGAFIDQNDVYPEVEHINTHPRLYTANDKLLGVMDNEITFPEGVARIPTFTKLSYAPVRIAKLNFEKLKSFDDSIVENKYKQAKRVESIHYAEEDSPLKITSRLYVYASKNDPMVIENEFYISNVIKTKSLPLKKLPQSVAERGDLFFIEKPSKNIFWKTSKKVGIEAGKVSLTILGAFGIYALKSAVGLEDVEF